MCEFTLNQKSQLEELVYLKTKQKRVLMWKSRKNRKEKKILMKPWKSINAGWRWKSVTRESFVNEEKSFRLVPEVWKRDEWGGGQPLKSWDKVTHTD